VPAASQPIPGDDDALVVSPTRDPNRVKTADGRILSPPPGWGLLPPGDAGLTRRVKAAGSSWTVVELKGNKKFSRGVWAPQAHIDAATADLEKERGTEAYARRREADARRREKEPAEYEEDFYSEILAFLRFSPLFEPQARLMATLVTEHAVPVGSGTVARTERIPIERRAEAAVIAWMRHQTTHYDHMVIARVKGRRREVRSELAGESRRLLDNHRRREPHSPAACQLCRTLEQHRLIREAQRPRTETGEHD